MDRRPVGRVTPIAFSCWVVDSLIDCFGQRAPWGRNGVPIKIVPQSSHRKKPCLNCIDCPHVLETFFFVNPGACFRCNYLMDKFAEGQSVRRPGCGRSGETLKEPPRPLPTLESMEEDPKDGREGWGRGERHGRRRRHPGGGGRWGQAGPADCRWRQNGKTIHFADICICDEHV